MTRLLLVEDDDLVRELLTQELSALGYETDSAKTQAEAERLLGIRSHDLIFCDLVLPDGRGSDVARLAKEFGIPAILMTGYQEVSEEMLFAGVLHLSKPFSVGTLRAVLEHHLGEPTENPSR